MSTVVHFVENRDESIVTRTPYADAVDRLAIAQSKRMAGMAGILELTLQDNHQIAIPVERVEYLEER